MIAKENVKTNKKKSLSNLIKSLLDIFYPIFKSYMNKKTYYYLACGGSNTLLSFVIFYVSLHFILDKSNLNLIFITISPHIAAFLISFVITFPIGFLLSKYIVWNESYLKGKQQFSRHFALVMIFLFLNYVMLKYFVEMLGWWPMLSQILSTVIIVILNYFSQKHFSFKH